MSNVKLIAVHHIIRTGGDVLPGKPFLEEAEEAERLVAGGAAVYAPAAEEAAAAAKAPAKAGKKGAAAAPAEPDLGNDDGL